MKNEIEIEIDKDINTVLFNYVNDIQKFDYTKKDSDSIYTSNGRILD